MPALSSCRLSLGLGASLAFASTSAALAHATCPPDFDDYARFHAVHARHGMVVSEHALATRIGLSVLEHGGNAVDAAVAVGFALAVVLPNAGNLGGGGFMVLHDAIHGRQTALDFRETAPAALASLDVASAPSDGGHALHPPLAVGVPGTVAGLSYASRHWGTLPLAATIAPAIVLAERGFRVTAPLARRLQQEAVSLGRWSASRAIFFKDGMPLPAGAHLVQTDLAHSLREIARGGPRAFYHGALGRRLVADVARHGGVLRRRDLEAYRVIEREPVRGRYRGFDIVSMPPPSSGGTHVVQILNLLERYPLASYGAGSAQNLHLLVEALKRAFIDRAAYLGDPDFVTVPVKGLTSKRYADDLAKTVSLTAVHPAATLAPGQPLPYESEQTTHYSVVDAQGNAVAVTYTLNENFGSGIVAAGTGILLNDQLNGFSRPPGSANALRPGKRPLSSMAPTLVLKDGAPWIVTGSPGSERIISVTVQTLLDLIDFGMNPAEAAAAPRLHYAWPADELRVEKGMSEDTLQRLRGQGYRIVVNTGMGRTQTIERCGDGWDGAADPRNPDGAAFGY